MKEVFEKADALLPSRDMCTYLRAAVGGVSAGFFPKPDLVVCTSHLCESAPKIAQITARHYGVGFNPLDVPAAPSFEAIEYVAVQLEQLAHRLCELSGTRFDLERLRHAVELTNQARSHFLGVSEIRKHAPAYVTGSQFIGLSLVYPWGTEEGVAIAETLHDELSRRAAARSLAVEGGENNRFMWIHLRPVFETDIMRYMEHELRSVIVVDVLDEVYWPELDAADPFRALAVKMLSHPDLQPMEQKVNRLITLAREYAVNGVVHFLHWGCRWNYGQTFIYKQAVTAQGLPYLALDGDAVDKNSTPHGQVLTRLEAFLELLNSTGSQRHAR